MRGRPVPRAVTGRRVEQGPAVTILVDTRATVRMLRRLEKGITVKLQRVLRPLEKYIEMRQRKHIDDQVEMDAGVENAFEPLRNITIWHKQVLALEGLIPTANITKPLKATGDMYRSITATSRRVGRTAVAFLVSGSDMVAEHVFDAASRRIPGIYNIQISADPPEFVTIKNPKLPSRKFMFISPRETRHIIKRFVINWRKETGVSMRDLVPGLESF